jgi:GTP-binding protein EngB required for normal cell division
MSINNAIEYLDKERENVRVSVAFFGQPGSGKSSLINCIVGENLAKVGSRNDITQEIKEYEWNNLYLADFPGYGTKMFPHTTFLEKFNISHYDFFLCVFSGSIAIPSQM